MSSDPILTIYTKMSSDIDWKSVHATLSKLTQWQPTFSNFRAWATLCRFGSVERVRHHLKRFPELATLREPQQQESPAMWTADNDDVKVLATLLEMKADPNAMFTDGPSPMRAAAVCGNVAHMDLLKRYVDKVDPGLANVCVGMTSLDEFRSHGNFRATQEEAWKFMIPQRLKALEWTLTNCPELVNISMQCSTALPKPTFCLNIQTTSTVAQRTSSI